jgi:hypothetical protein
MEEECNIALLKIQLVRLMHHSLYAFVIVSFLSSNLTQSATLLIVAASRFAGPLHQQTFVKLK